MSTANQMNLCFCGLVEEYWRCAMAIDGTWEILIKTALMPLKGTLVFKTEGNVLSGTSKTSFGASTFDGGKVDGNKIEFTVDASTPFGRSNLDVKGTVDGDKLTGEAIMQPRGMKAALTGTRVA
jgi:hypothetical protein